MEKFIQMMSEVFEMEPNDIKLSDNFRDYDEWSSLSQLTLVALANENYGIVIGKNELESFETVQDIFDFLNSK